MRLACGNKNKEYDKGFEEKSRVTDLNSSRISLFERTLSTTINVVQTNWIAFQEKTEEAAANT